MWGMALNESVDRSMLDGRDWPGVDMGVPDASVLLHLKRAFIETGTRPLSD